jgi:ribosome-associated protein
MDTSHQRIRISIPASEIELTYVRSSGPGGQNVNKVSSKCQLRWNAFQSLSLPPHLRERVLARLASRLTASGDLVLSSDQFRDQGRNRDECIAKLHAILAQAATVPKVRKATRPTRSSQRRREASKKRHGEKKGLRGRVRES